MQNFFLNSALRVLSRFLPHAMFVPYIITSWKFAQTRWRSLISLQKVKGWIVEAEPWNSRANLTASGAAVNSLRDWKFLVCHRSWEHYASFDCYLEALLLIRMVKKYKQCYDEVMHNFMNQIIIMFLKNAETRQDASDDFIEVFSNCLRHRIGDFFPKMITYPNREDT